eukprot:5089371-Pyramimonas_sp.AAC.2
MAIKLFLERFGPKSSSFLRALPRDLPLPRAQALRTVAIKLFLEEELEEMAPAAHHRPAGAAPGGPPAQRSGPRRPPAPGPAAGAGSGGHLR